MCVLTYALMGPSPKPLRSRVDGSGGALAIPPRWQSHPRSGVRSRPRAPGSAPRLQTVSGLLGRLGIDLGPVCDKGQEVIGLGFCLFATSEFGFPETAFCLPETKTVSPSNKHIVRQYFASGKPIFKIIGKRQPSLMIS